MRDTLLIGIVGVLALVALFRPWVGVMGWTLISIMNPHRYSWAASKLPVAAVIAIATLVGLLITRDRRASPFTAPTIVLLAFMAWISLTFPFSFSVDQSFAMWDRVMKIDLMIIVATVALTRRTHVMALAWVLVGSIGLFGFKGGIFTLLHGGVYRVWGPPDSFIEGNNELALALVMTIPLMRFLQLQAGSRLVTHGLTVLMLLSAIAAIGTQSRGALLAIVAMAAMMIMRGGGRKVWLGVSLVVAGIAIVAFMPSAWDNRMSTILDYQKDSSALGRINAWWMAWHLASNNLLGGGFAIYDAPTFARYAPNPQDIHAAHSIYFQVLGEHGFIGLALFLAIWALAWRWGNWLRRHARGQESGWAADLGSLCQVSIVGYAVGGAFLSLAYFDLPSNLLVLLVVARRVITEQARETAPIERERSRAVFPEASRPIS
jgi:putative inorganic carbon (hco3(-)) transporter